MTAEPRVIVCLHDLTLWYLVRTNRFPKNRRVTLGDKIDNLLLDMLTIAHLASMIFDSYACRKGKGTHAAADRYTEFSRKAKYVLKGCYRFLMYAVNFGHSVAVNFFPKLFPTAS